MSSLKDKYNGFIIFSIMSVFLASISVFLSDTKRRMSSLKDQYDGAGVVILKRGFGGEIYIACNLRSVVYDAKKKLKKAIAKGEDSVTIDLQPILESVGGKIEPRDETIMNTAVREFLEEYGIKSKDDELLADLTDMKYISHLINKIKRSTPNTSVIGASGLPICIFTIILETPEDNEAYKVLTKYMHNSAETAGTAMLSTSVLLNSALIREARTNIKPEQTPSEQIKVVKRITRDNPVVFTTPNNVAPFKGRIRDFVLFYYRAVLEEYMGVKLF